LHTECCVVDADRAPLVQEVEGDAARPKVVAFRDWLLAEAKG
jgi:hypothetical protein